MQTGRIRVLSLLFLAFAFLFIGNASASGCGTIPSAQSALTLQCIPLNITNYQATQTPSGLQVMLPFNAMAYNTVLSSTMNNIYVYNGVSAVPMPAWFEGSLANEIATTNLNQSTNDIIWLNLGANTIGATSSANGIYYIGVGAKSTNFFLPGNDIGEAPQLSSTYGAYDDGASVFPYYQRFGGLSSTPSGWTTFGTQTYNYQPTYLGMYSGTDDTYGGISIPTSSVSTSNFPLVYELYGNIYNNEGSASSSTEAFGIIDAAAGATVYDNFAYIIQGNGFGRPTVYLTGDNNGYYFNTTYTPPNSPLIYSFLGTSATTGTFMANYGSSITATGFTSESLSYLTLTAATATSQLQAYWLRTRAYPPSGVMPSTTFGTLTAATTLSISPNPSIYGQAITLTASCASPTDTCDIDYPSLGTHIATGTGSATYTYTSGALGAGTYSSYYANDITTGQVSSGIVLTINKDKPIMVLNNCTNEALPYTCTTTGTFYAINTISLENQDPARLYLNNALLGTTTSSTNTLSDVVSNLIGTHAYVFNSLGGANYTANSIAVSWTAYAQVFAENVTSTGATKTFTLIPTNSPRLWPTYYPIKIYTTSPNTLVNFTLNQTIASVTTALQTKVANLSFIPPANQITGNYIYKILERQQGNPLTVAMTINATTLNMTDMNGALTLNSPTIQYYQNAAYFPSAANVFTVKPTNWQIIGDSPLTAQYNMTGQAYNTVNFTDANLTFTPKIKLVYPFATFTMNLTDNPKVQNTITQTALAMVLANSINANMRTLANFSIFSQGTFNGIKNVNASLLLNLSINGYVFSKTLSNTSTTNGLYYVLMSKSNYHNPAVTYTMNVTLAPPPATPFFSQSSTYCPTTVNYGSTAAYTLGLADANGSKYNFYVYTSSGTSAQNYIMQITEQKGVGTIQVQSYRIPPQIPFVLPLEAVGQEYAFNIYSPDCKTNYYTGALSVPSNPIYITISSSSSAVIYNISKATGSCAINGTIGNDYNIKCIAGDPTQLAYKYNLLIFNQTSELGTTMLIKNVTFAGSTFNYNFTEPKNRSYSYAIYAYEYKQFDPVFWMAGGILTLGLAQISAPLLGLIALILMLILVFGGAATGKLTIMLALGDIGFVAVTVFGLVGNGGDIVTMIFIIISVMLVYWNKKNTGGW